MNGRKLMGAVGAFVVMFGLGGLWHQVLMSEYYAAILPSVARAEPNLSSSVAGISSRQSS